MWKVMEQPSVGLKCLYLLLYPSNIFELLISLGLYSSIFALQCFALELGLGLQFIRSFFWLKNK